MSSVDRIVVFGAGSVGCYLGGRLQAAGAPVRMVGRATLADAVQRHGLSLTDLHGADCRVEPAQVDFVVDEPAAAADAGLVLVTVKSAATEASGRALAPVLAPGTCVISLQNGIDNAALLQSLLPQCRVLAGMVPFNIVNRGEGRFHQGSDGQLMVQASPELSLYLPVFAAAGLALNLRDNMRAVLWGKLLLNLNNSINALCGLPLKEELSQRDFRRCLAAAQREGLQLLQASGETVAAVTPLPPRLLPRLLTLPDWVFRRAASRMLAIDPLARSSMWEDLQAGRPTEIAWLNGELLRLAARLDLPAPVNQRLTDLIRDAEQGGRRDWSAPALLAQLQSKRLH